MKFKLKKIPGMTTETGAMLVLILIGIHLFVWGFNFHIAPPKTLLDVLLYPLVYLFKWGLEAFGLYLAVHSFVALIFLELNYYMNNYLMGGDIFGLSDHTEPEGEGEGRIPDKGIYT